MTLVVTLLILSLAATTVMLVTGLIAMQIRISVNTVNAISAYYAGESGIEQSLYYLQYSRNLNDFANNFDQLEKNSNFNLVNLTYPFFNTKFSSYLNLHLLK
jgi:predicted membrane-bound dolichyl-phosphate-mannose-protein mannosyltransferase